MYSFIFLFFITIFIFSASSEIWILKRNSLVLTLIISIYISTFTSTTTSWTYQYYLCGFSFSKCQILFKRMNHNVFSWVSKRHDTSINFFNLYFQPCVCWTTLCVKTVFFTIFGSLKCSLKNFTLSNIVKIYLQTPCLVIFRFKIHNEL